MLETRTGDTWHLARTESGVYFRLGSQGTSITLPTATAKEIRDALEELLDAHSTA